MRYPKISIITPTYNQVDYIEQTILSVLNQNYPNLEYLILDGGSNDGTLEIIKKYESKLSYWSTGKDEGMYDAIYKGLEKSTGDILAWINSDDIYLPNAFYTIAEIFSNFPDVSWLEGANSHIDERGRLVSTYGAHYLTKYDYFSGNIKSIQQESTFFRRNLWIDSGKKLNIKSQLAGDFGLWVSFFKTQNLYFTTAPIGCFRFRSSNQKSLTHKKEYYQEISYILSETKYNLPFFTRYFYEFLYITGIFRILYLLKLDIKFKQFFFKTTKRICFDRHKQKFVFE